MDSHLTDFDDGSDSEELCITYHEDIDMDVHAPKSSKQLPMELIFNCWLFGVAVPTVTVHSMRRLRHALLPASFSQLCTRAVEFGCSILSLETPDVRTNIAALSSKGLPPYVRLNSSL